MAPPMRLLLGGSLAKVENIDSLSTVSKAKLKPVRRGDVELGSALRAARVLAAAGKISSQLKPIQSRSWASSARRREAAVWATTPGLGSQKMPLVMAWRRTRARLTWSRDVL